MKLFLHIGTGKTGTTTIQRSLWVNRDWLADRGYWVLRTGRTSTGLAKHKTKWGRSPQPEWAAWRREIFNLDSRIEAVILSNEGLFRKPSRAIEHIRGCFTGLDARVIMYVRDQAEFAQSLALYRLKTGSDQYQGVPTMDELRPSFGGGRIDYLQVCKRYDSVFGEGSIQARAFSPALFEGGDLMTDFLSAFGITPVDGLQQTTEANVGIGPDLVELVDAACSSDPNLRRDDLVDIAKQLTRERPTEKYFLSKDEVEEIREMYRESNSEFEQRYLVNASKIPQRPVWRTSAPDPQLAQEFERRILARAWESEPST